MSIQFDDASTAIADRPITDELVVFDPANGALHRLCGTQAAVARRLLSDSTATSESHELSTLRPLLAATTSTPVDGPVLDDREAEVLHLLAAGHSNESIASILHFSVATVRRTTSAIYRCLGARNRASAIARAHELRLLT